MLRDIGDSVLVSVRRWADPREREIRKRRRARRRGIRYGAASGVTALGAAGLAVAAAPVWIVVATTGGAAVLVLPAALATRKYLRLRDAPLPPAAPPVRALPPVGSSARPAIARLAHVERSLHDVLGVVARLSPVPAEELAETAATAQSAAGALEALAVDIVALERAAHRVGRPGPELQRSIAFALGELLSGLSEYEHLLEAAARMTSPLGLEQRSPLASANRELRVAADRLDGWADALAELANPAAIGPGRP
ncbi:phage shock envelope stress response protein PspM [Antrihabitans spumae]|uniref:Uncharacterized protein n=1 Tax=Antrihabitans spumae TaxID=3373370 RepID=A0ABW7KKH8_9NOCA